MFTIQKEEGRKGWAWVRDYLGNIWYYGTIKECKAFIDDIERSFQ